MKKTCHWFNIVQTKFPCLWNMNFQTIMRKLYLISAVLNTAAGENNKAWSLPCDHTEGFYCSCCWCLWCSSGTFQFLQIGQKLRGLLRKCNKSDGGNKREGQGEGHESTTIQRGRTKEKATEKTHASTMTNSQTNRTTRTYIRAEN